MASVGGVPTHGERANAKNAAPGDAAYNKPRPDDAGRVPQRGVPVPTGGAAPAGRNSCRYANPNEFQAPAGAAQSLLGNSVASCGARFWPRAKLRGLAITPSEAC